MKKILLICLISILMMAVPANASELKIGDEVLINDLKATVIGFQNGQPIYHSIIALEYASNSDGSIRLSDSVYANARTATESDYIYPLTIGNTVSNNYSASLYRVEKGFLYFDTSDLFGYTPTAGSIYLYVYGKGDTNAESVQVQSGMPTYPHDPLVAGDYDLTHYAGSGGTQAIAGITVGQYNAIALNATGYGWINTSGTTKYCLRTTGDINGVAPTGTNYITYYSGDYDDDYVPYLSVTYTVLAPTGISVDASEVQFTTARLNALITYDGGDSSCQVRYGYGKVSQTAGNFNLYTTLTAWVDGYHTGDRPYLDVDSLDNSDTYYYRVQIKNTNSTITSADEQTFDTETGVAEVSKFLGLPGVTSISLSWVRGAGASQALVRYSSDTYPATTADGIFVYEGAATSFTHSGLDDGTTYYYTIWGESGGTYSAVGENLVMTTNADVSDSSSNPASAMPTGWMQEPSGSFLVNLEPLYTTINGFADSWGMPRGNMWLALSLLFIAILGVGLYIAFHAPSLSLIVMALVMLAFVTLHVLSSFMLIIVVFLALGAWSSRPQGV